MNVSRSTPTKLSVNSPTIARPPASKSNSSGSRLSQSHSRVGSYSRVGLRSTSGASSFVMSSSSSDLLIPVIPTVISVVTPVPALTGHQRNAQSQPRDGNTGRFGSKSKSKK